MNAIELNWLNALDRKQHKLSNIVTQTTTDMVYQQIDMATP